MPILTNSTGRKLYVLHRLSNDQILARSVVYPAAIDDAPIVGLDPDLEYLAMDRDVQPDYDPRVFTLSTSEAKNGTLWHITYNTTKKAVDQIKIAVTNVERAKLTDQVPTEEMNKLVILTLGILASKQDSLQLTVEQQAVLDRMNVAASKVWQNDANSAKLFADIDANKVPDLDSGWAAKP